jgi:hypothetical protein
VKPFLLTALGAFLLAAGAPAPAQQQPPLQSPVQATMTQDCVTAGPSFGDCRAVGRYSQSYRDVEGGRPRGVVASIVDARADGTSTPASLTDRKVAAPGRP